MVYVEPHPRRVQAVRDGRTVIDTERALMVHRRDHPLSYAFPADEVGDLPQRAGRRRPRDTSACRGMRSTRGSRRAAGSSTTRRTRITGSTAGRPNRGLRVTVAGAVLVDTTETVIVFETALEPRLYVAPVVGAHRLVAAHRETSSYCNYKGDATYWSAVIGDPVVEDVAWSYQDPPPETLPIKGYFSFDAALADVLAELPESAGAAGCGCEV